MQTMLNKTRAGSRLIGDVIGRVVAAGGRIWAHPNLNEEQIGFRKAASVAELDFADFGARHRGRNAPVRLNGVLRSGPVPRKVFQWSLWIDANTGGRQSPRRPHREALCESSVHAGDRRPDQRRRLMNRTSAGPFDRTCLLASTAAHIPEGHDGPMAHNFEEIEMHKTNEAHREMRAGEFRRNREARHGYRVDAEKCWRERPPQPQPRCWSQSAETAFSRNRSEFERSGYAAFGWRTLAGELVDEPDIFRFGAGDVDDENSFWSWVHNFDADAASRFYDIVKSY